jgi:hypothetical protein
VPKLSVVTTGQIPPNPSELLMHARFEVLLTNSLRRFDTVIVDAPPVLAVSDAAIIGRHVGATLMVARAGKHPIRELEQAVKRLNQAGVRSRASSSMTSTSAARVTATVTRATSIATRTRIERGGASTCRRLAPRLAAAAALRRGRRRWRPRR